MKKASNCMYEQRNRNRETMYSTQMHRLFIAFSVVVALLLFLGISACIGSNYAQSEQRNKSPSETGVAHAFASQLELAENSASDSHSPGIEIDKSFLFGNPFDVLNKIDSQIDEAGIVQLNDIPEAFNNEIGLPAQAKNVRMDAAKTVISYEVSLPLSEAIEELESSMCTKDWTLVPLGEIDGFTCVKADGDLRWALITGTSVSDQTIIVIRVQV